MGDEADYIMQQAMMCDNDFGFEEDEPDFTVWVSRDLSEIPIKDMTNGHLKNTIALIEKRTKWNDYYIKGFTWRERWLPYLKKELEDRELKSKWMDTQDT